MPFTICRSLTSMVSIISSLQRRGLRGWLGAACKNKMLFTCKCRSQNCGKCHSQNEWLACGHSTCRRSRQRLSRRVFRVWNEVYFLSRSQKYDCNIQMEHVLHPLLRRQLDILVGRQEVALEHVLGFFFGGLDPMALISAAAIEPSPGSSSDSFPSGFAPARGATSSNMASPRTWPAGGRWGLMQGVIVSQKTFLVKSSICSSNVPTVRFRGWSVCLSALTEQKKLTTEPFFDAVKVFRVIAWNFPLKFLEGSPRLSLKWSYFFNGSGDLSFHFHFPPQITVWCSSAERM